MTLSKSSDYLTFEEYLEAEKHSQIKHEYIQGKVYAMAGASDSHVTITLNATFALRNHLRGGSCRVYAMDMKVRIEVADVSYYPDVFVTCDERDRNSAYVKNYPTSIVEVLSPSTASFDRGRKFTDYRKLETLQEYVIIDTEQVSIDCFRRNSEGNWVFYHYGEGDEVYLASVDFRCPIAALYEDALPLATND